MSQFYCDDFEAQTNYLKEIQILKTVTAIFFDQRYHWLCIILVQDAHYFLPYLYVFCLHFQFEKFDMRTSLYMYLSLKVHIIFTSNCLSSTFSHFCVTSCVPHATYMYVQASCIVVPVLNVMVLLYLIKRIVSSLVM